MLMFRLVRFVMMGQLVGFAEIGMHASVVSVLVVVTGRSSGVDEFSAGAHTAYSI